MKWIKYVLPIRKSENSRLVFGRGELLYGNKNTIKSCSLTDFSCHVHIPLCALRWKIFALSSHTREKNYCGRPCVDPFAVKRDEPEILRSILEGSIEHLCSEYRELVVKLRAPISLPITVQTVLSRAILENVLESTRNSFRGSAHVRSIITSNVTKKITIQFRWISFSCQKLKKE